MKTEVSEIADKIYRLSTFVPQIGPTGFTFNQFLIDADQPLLFHYGQRALFPLISEAVKSVIPLDRLRWTTCSHVEADESGALNQWLAAAPNATPAHGQIGCNIWLTDMADRPPRALKNDEVLDLGGKRVRWLDTPHVPHNWDAGVIYEETTGTLFSSDLFGGRIGGAKLGEEIAAEQRAAGLLENHAGIPVVRHVRRVEPAHRLAAEIEHLVVLEYARRSVAHVGQPDVAADLAMRRRRLGRRGQPLVERA